MMEPSFNVIITEGGIAIAGFLYQEEAEEYMKKMQRRFRLLSYKMVDVHYEMVNLND